MNTCSNCQFSNPPVHKFCQRCGEPLPVPPQAEPMVQVVSVEGTASQPVKQCLRANLMPPDTLDLSPAAYLDEAKRYQVVTVLNRGSALIADRTFEVRSPLQTQLAKFAKSSTPPDMAALQSVPHLPVATYPYLILSHAAPLLYDAWQQSNTTVLVTQESAQVEGRSLIESFGTAVDPLQHVYWLYTLTELWAVLEAVPQWRSSLLLTDNLAIGPDQSVRVQRFIPPALQPPVLADLKAFLQSLLAQPHRGAIAPLRQIRQIILAVTSSSTLAQLQSELAAIGESLLATPAAITPAVATGSMDNNMGFPVSRAQPVTAKNTFADDMTTEDSIEKEDPLEKMVLTEPLDQLASGADDTADAGESTMVLPMKLVSLESAGRTDVGRQRDHNEDRFFISSSTQKRADNGGQTTLAHSLYILCDGMGGHAGGEVASRIATETLSAYFTEHWPHPLPGEAPSPLPTEDVIAEAVKLANASIFGINEQENRAGHERMGTTLVMVLLQGTEAVVAHVGDSRLYQHARRTGLRQVTTDHEVGQREIQRGIPHDLAYARSDAYQLTQALGPRGNTEIVPSVSYLSFSEDSLLLLCSDGLSDNNLVEDYLSSHIDPVLRGKKEMEAGIDALIDLGNEVNGHDNISAIAIRIKVSPDMSKMRGATVPNPQRTIIQ